MSTPVLHICYIHGWKGDHTSFQSFPTDLHAYLEPRMRDVNLQTHIYPTYKAERPIQEATLKILNWLSTLPKGLVILAGHSLGGFLAADAALLNTLNKDADHRVIGLLAFDVPYLGIHPHVIITGIASLFQKDGDGHGPNDEAALNDTRMVNIVEAKESTTSLAPAPAENSRSRSPSPSRVHRAMNFLSRHTHDPLGSGKRWLTENLEFGSCVVDQQGLTARFTALESWSGDWVQLFTITAPGSSPAPPSRPHTPTFMPGAVEPGAHLGGIPVEVSPYGADAHAHPISDTRAISSTGTGSISEFEAFKDQARREKQLRDHKQAEATRIEEERKSHETESHVVESPAVVVEPPADSVADQHQRALPQPTPLQSTHSDSSVSISHHRSSKPHAPRHFIVLPWAMSYRWQSVRIAGVDDEVAAHTGMFFRKQNFEYDALVTKVGGFVEEWRRKHV